MVSVVAIGLAACSASDITGAGGGSDSTYYTDPASPHLIGTAPVTYNGTLEGNTSNLAGRGFYKINIAAGGQYNFTLSDFSPADVDMLVLDHPLVDMGYEILCLGMTYDTPESCTITSSDTATLTEVYIYLDNLDPEPVNFTLTVD